MTEQTEEPWIPQTTKDDWKFTDGALYFKNCLYIPDMAHHDLVQSLHQSPAGGHEGFFHTLH